MKGIKELLLDESPKNQKKLAKLLSKDPVSASFLEAVKSEARGSGAIDYPKLHTLVTDSFLCYHDFGIGGGLTILPISTIHNLYRTNTISGEYCFYDFFLAVETESATRYLMRLPRSGNGIDKYQEVIAAVRARMTVNGGM